MEEKTVISRGVYDNALYILTTIKITPTLEVWIKTKGANTDFSVQRRENGFLVHAASDFSCRHITEDVKRATEKKLKSIHADVLSKYKDSTIAQIKDRYSLT